MKTDGDLKALDIGPDEISQAVFRPAKKVGYNTEDVDAFLDKVSTELLEVSQYLDWSNAEISRLRSQKKTLVEAMEHLRSRPSDARPVDGSLGNRSLADGFGHVVMTVHHINPSAIFDEKLLPNYILDIAPDMRAEVSLVRIAFELGAMKALSSGGNRVQAKARAKGLLVESFIDPNVAGEFVEAIAACL